MNKNQFSHIEMFNTVLQYLEQNRSPWEGSLGVSNLITRIREETRLLMDKMLRQTTPTHGAAVEKGQVRQELELSILRMATYLTLFAVQAEDQPLAAQCDVSPSSLADLSLEALGGTGERIHQLLAQHLAALAEFGLTEAEAAGFQSLLHKYQEAKSAPRRAVAERARETSTLPSSIRGLSRLFRQLDRLMTQFRTSHPEFHAGYLSVRVIIDRRHAVPKAAPAAPSPTTAGSTTATEPKTGSEAGPKA